MNGERKVQVPASFVKPPLVSKQFAQVTEKEAFERAVADFAGNRKRSFKKSLRLLGTTSGTADQAEIASDNGLFAPVTDLAINGKSKVKINVRVVRQAPIEVHISKVAGVDTFHSTIADFAMDDERLFEMLARLVVAPLGGVHDAQITDEISLESAIADLTCNHKRSFEVHTSILDPALIAPQVAQTGEDERFVTAVPDAAAQRESLLKFTGGFVTAPGAAQRDASHWQRRGTLRSIEMVDGKHLCAEIDSQRAWSLCFEYFPDRLIGVNRILAIGAAHCPAASGDQIVEFESKRAPSPDAAVSAKRFARCIGSVTREVPPVALLS